VQALPKRCQTSRGCDSVIKHLDGDTSPTIPGMLGTCKKLSKFGVVVTVSMDCPYAPPCSSSISSVSAETWLILGVKVMCFLFRQPLLLYGDLDLGHLQTEV
jgi:hypothetical protein